MDRRRGDSVKFDVVPVLYHYGMVQEPIGRKVYCPFHSDTHPSASIDDNQVLFYCHVCGIGGDAVAIIRERDGADYQTAVSKAEELSTSVHQPVRRTTKRRRGLFGR